MSNICCIYKITNNINGKFYRSWKKCPLSIEPNVNMAAGEEPAVGKELKI